MNITINSSQIDKSFEDIAKSIMLNHALLVNKTELRFTELEFYYFEEKVHEDYFTHEHQCGECEWRFHNQGLDITFGHTDKSDGGILIRGVSYVDHGKTICVNGPRRVVATIAFPDICSVPRHTSSPITRVDSLDRFRIAFNSTISSA